MKSKLALVLMAAVGSAALAASAQTPSPSPGDASSKDFTTPYFTVAKPAQTSGETVRELKATTVRAEPEQESSVSVGTTTRAFVVDPTQQVTRSVNTPQSPGSYSTSRVYGGVHPFLARMNFSGEEASISHEADQLARQLGEAKSEAERDKLMTKLGETLEKQFDQRQKRHEHEIQELETQVKKLKGLVSRRQENRREIIGKRMEQVLREAQGLGW